MAELVGGVHEFSSPLLTSGSEIPSRADTFFCTSMMSSACSRRRLRRVFSARSRWFSSASGWAEDFAVTLLASQRFPFALFTKSHKLRAEDEVLVYPAVRPVPLPPPRAPLLGDASQSRLGRRGEFFGLREYRDGDDSRAIHWLTSARAGRLLLREMEEEAQRRVVIELDNAITDPGDGWTGNLFDDSPSGNLWNYWLIWAAVAVWREGAGGREWLVLHRRYAVGPEWSWTPPSGMRDPGETPLASIQGSFPRLTSSLDQGDTRPAIVTAVRKHNQHVGITWTHVFGTRTVQEIRGGIGHVYNGMFRDDSTATDWGRVFALAALAIATLIAWMFVFLAALEFSSSLALGVILLALWTAVAWRFLARVRARRGESLGLLTMEERASLVGGTLVASVLPAAPWLKVTATVVLAVLGYAIPSSQVNGLAAKRQRMIQKQLADVMDLLTISVEAGLGFDAAVAQVVKNVPGPLAEEMARLLQEMQIGVSRADAFRHMGERTTVPELEGFVLSMIQADMFGVSIAGVLRAQSKELRVKRRQRAEELAQKIPVKLLFPMIFMILPALFIIVLGPGAIQIYEQFFG